MKTSLTLLTAFALGVAAPVFAGPPCNYYETIRREAQARALQTGTKVLYVCTQCKSVSEHTIESEAQAMDHCRENATVTCPICKTTYRVVLVGPPKNPTPKREIKYVNDKGEECLFVVKVSDKKD
ncbi:MAG: hypothetical protein HYV95_17165 [Opitutae bacterium]|nr:hypothetical protein [Opitutae bacterium]